MAIMLLVLIIKVHLLALGGEESCDFRDLALTDVAADYEAAMWTFPVR
jgi:hypothetical protein